MNPATRDSAFALLALTLACTPARAQVPDPIRPDPQLTPGATVVVGHEVLCTPGYAREVRYVPADVHRAVFRKYGLIGVRTRDYEVDHLIPLSLGGANDIANLWPESRRTRPWNAVAKDVLEGRLSTEWRRQALFMRLRQHSSMSLRPMLLIKPIAAGRPRDGRMVDADRVPQARALGVG